MFIGLLSVCTIASFSGSLASNSEKSMKCISLNNRPCPARATRVDISSNETIFYSFTAKFDNCCGSCNTNGDPHARDCVPNNVKNMNFKVFNLISGANETKFSFQQEWCQCKCELNESVCNLK